MKNNNTDLQISLPVEKLVEGILEMIKPHLTKEEIETKHIDTFLTRQEAAEILNISLPTLHQYTKKRLLNSYRLGARILYKKSEVESAPLNVCYGRDLR
jgi:excisionase family DNA binding protein